MGSVSLSTVLCGDALVVLSGMPDASADCIVTSPPYHGQRDYKIHGQIGLEDGFKNYLAKLVATFDEIKRVLKPTGTMWINCGDSYVNDGGTGAQGVTGERADRRLTQRRLIPQNRDLGLRPKSLVGQPWRLAFALQERGWILRQEIIWQKRAPSPESAKDRPARSHETIFLFAKSDHYCYDEFAVLEPCSGGAKPRGKNLTPRANGVGRDSGIRNNETWGRAHSGMVGLRNCRSVWSIPSKPFADEWCTACSTLFRASDRRRMRRDEKDRPICSCGSSTGWIGHFASYPVALAEKCILAGSSEHGCCSLCGVPYSRIVERQKRGDWTAEGAVDGNGKSPLPAGIRRSNNGSLAVMTEAYRLETGNHDFTLPTPKSVGWKKNCKCLLGEVVPATVLDPFSGAGTTLLAAAKLGRDGIGIELNPEYAAMSRARLAREVSA